MTKGQRYELTPRGKYHRHRKNARTRGVAFELTFDQWMHLWNASGRWAQRGNRAGQYVMLRLNDAGAYSMANVYIALMEVNVAECNRTRHIPEAQRSANADVPF